MQKQKGETMEAHPKSGSHMQIGREKIPLLKLWLNS